MDKDIIIHVKISKDGSRFIADMKAMKKTYPNRKERNKILKESGLKKR